MQVITISKERKIMTYDECKDAYINSKYNILCDDGEYLLMYRIYGSEFSGKEITIVKFEKDVDIKPSEITVVEHELEKLVSDIIS